MIFRILASIILLFSALFLPFYISIILAILGIIYFSFFWEAVVLFTVIDLIYGINEARFLNVRLISLLVLFLLFLIIEFLKKRMKLNF